MVPHFPPHFPTLSRPFPPFLSACIFPSFPTSFLPPFLTEAEAKNVTFTCIGIPNCFGGTKLCLTQQQPITDLKSMHKEW